MSRRFANQGQFLEAAFQQVKDEFAMPADFQPVPFE